MSKKLRYTGAQDHNCTIRVGGKETDLRLTKGEDTELPEDHPHVKALIKSGLLVDANIISTKK